MTTQTPDPQDLTNFGMQTLFEEAGPPLATTRATLFATGLGRSGTTMVARVMTALGLHMGDDLSVRYHEDQDILSVAKARDHAGFAAICRKRDAQHERWGFKCPAIRGDLPGFSRLMRNPRCIVIFRDILAISMRNQLSVGVDGSHGLELAAQADMTMVRQILAAEIPTLVISYEKALQHPEHCVRAIAAHCGIPVSDSRVAEIANATIRNGDLKYMGLPQDAGAGADAGLPSGVIGVAQHQVAPYSPERVKTVAERAVPARTKVSDHMAKHVVSSRDDPKRSKKKRARQEALLIPQSGADQVALHTNLTDHLIRLFSLRTILNRPVYLAQSDLLEHVPFAFWLMEAQTPQIFVELGTGMGVSYFAFCQSAERLGHDVKAFAVDTWDTDPDTLTRIQQHNDTLYSGFSRIVQSTSDAALAHFSDGSIDLLHIATPQSYEAVKHDFETWLPKLSDRAVVVFHGSNIRKGNSGVFQLIDELRETSAMFEFIHGNGLTVVGVGPRQNSSLTRLFASAADLDARYAIHSMFGRLGRACADSHIARTALADRTSSRDAQAEIKQLTQQLTALESEAGRERRKADAALRADLDRLQVDRAALDRELGELRMQLRERGDEVAALTVMILDLQRAARDATATETALRGENATLTEALQIAQQRYDGILRSTSWKVSAPLRAVSQVVKRGPREGQ